MRLPLQAAFLTAAIAAAGPSLAESADEPMETASALRVNGFGTLGLTHVSDTPGWGFRRDISQPFNDGGTRADIDSRLGLQANYAVNPQLDIVGQVLLRRRSVSTPLGESLEWAFASYRTSAETTIRVGRIAPDLFLFSDHRNVGFAYPWVRPNIEAYALLPIFSIDSVDAEHIWDLGDVRWRAKLVGGSGNSRIPASKDRDAYFNIKSLVSGVVSREAGGLLLRATLTRSRGGLENLPFGPIKSGLASLQALPVPEVAAEAARLSSQLNYENGFVNYVAFGAAYDTGPWLVNAEFMRLNSDIAFVGFRSAYVAAARRFDAVSVFAMMGAGRSNVAAPTVPQWQAPLTPVIGAAAAAQAQGLGAAAAVAASGRIFQRSFSLGARWDVHPQIALKLQIDHFRVDANGGRAWGERRVEAASPNVVSATMDFVF